MKRQDSKADTNGRTQPDDNVYKKYREWRDDGGDYLWLLLMLIGFVAFVASLVWLSRRLAGD